MQTGSAIRIELLAVADIASDRQSFEVERDLHSMFSYTRRHGEFFQADDNLCDLIAMVAKGVGVREAMASVQPSIEKTVMRKNAKFTGRLNTPPVVFNAKAKRKLHRAQQRIMDRFVR
jgi:hypothetical protein